MSTTSQEQPLGYTPESDILRGMTRGILRNMQAIASKYGGAIWYDDVSGPVMSYGVPERMKREVDRRTYELWERDNPNPYRGINEDVSEEERDRIFDEWIDWRNRRADTAVQNQNEIDIALDNMRREYLSLLRHSWNQRNLEAMGDILRGLVKYGVSSKLSEYMEPEGEKPLYVPDLRRPERRKDR